MVPIPLSCLTLFSSPVFYRRVLIEKSVFKYVYILYFTFVSHELVFFFFYFFFLTKIDLKVM
jgi:hypothetical protein